MLRPGIGCGIIVYDTVLQKIMMGRRMDNNLFSLSGGHVERYETFEETAYRELLEETAIQVDPSEIYLYDYINAIRKNENYHYLCVFMCVTYPQGQPAVNTEPTKHGDWEWLDAQQIQELYNKKQLFYGFYDLITKMGGAQILFNDIKIKLTEKQQIKI